jgi:citrate lyase beta subunit
MGHRLTYRSWIIMPAHNARYTTKARGLPVDAVILDLEDGVIEADKEAARAAAIVVAESWDSDGPALFLRINAPGTPWFDRDVAAVRSPRIRGVLLPKASGNGNIAELVTRLREHGITGGADDRTVEIVLCLESPGSVLRTRQLARSDGVSGVIVGLEDLSRELGLSSEGRTYLQTSEFVRAAIAFGALSAGKYAIDCHYPMLHDDDALRADARKARNIGFEGKGVFHPSHVDIVNQSFSPSEQELADAREIIRSYETAFAAGGGTSYAAGQLVDLPVVNRARRLLASATASADIEDDADEGAGR